MEAKLAGNPEEIPAACDRLPAIGRISRRGGEAPEQVRVILLDASARLEWLHEGDGRRRGGRGPGRRWS
jgi:hypothetical protein